jgi:hypothetical protein
MVFSADVRLALVERVSSQPMAADIPKTRVRINGMKRCMGE